MKINIEEDKEINNLEVLIRCRSKDEEVDRLVQRIKGDGERLICYKDKTIHSIDVKDIFYIESVDNSVFVYLEEKVLETRLKLYELEDKLRNSYFVRCNKAAIINLAKVKLLEPQLNRSIMAHMDNGEQVYISRKYVKKLKELLGA
ncbi:MAG: LytTR family DNA-binding domain-containing protein [Bacillota bacterium]|nr:LytTR family DNA-binding domain-containing protein [Bacillota bacterium]